MCCCVSDEDVQELAGELVQLGLISEVGERFTGTVGVCVLVCVTALHVVQHTDPSP